MIPWLEPNAAPHFPNTVSALAEPSGLLAAGGSLEVEWLLVAYRQGIFPWFSENEPILWWSPAPRTVLYPKRFHQSKSLQKLARQQRYQITENQDFEAVIEACAGEREDQNGTWINAQMIDAYIDMHQAGFAHSIECRSDGELVGGLYGISLGRVFFGESMFSREASTSKLCLRHLVDCGRYEMIDCQLPTGHLQSLGAIEINREEFENALNRWT
ncbi:MAG: leucyl/phenylalanyl-tRNA--protein transferase [Gammaproteobacteria bacterium]|nr:leucyl/phenylalanyl-tRNA--protein transferase [Gammaproteobacteria bacterium]